MPAGLPADSTAAAVAKHGVAARSLALALKETLQAHGPVLQLNSVNMRSRFPGAFDRLHVLFYRSKITSWMAAQEEEYRCGLGHGRGSRRLSRGRWGGVRGAAAAAGREGNDAPLARPRAGQQRPSSTLPPRCLPFASPPNHTNQPRDPLPPSPPPPPHPAGSSCWRPTATPPPGPPSASPRPTARCWQRPAARSRRWPSRSSSCCGAPRRRSRRRSKGRRCSPGGSRARCERSRGRGRGSRGQARRAARTPAGTACGGTASTRGSPPRPAACRASAAASAPRLARPRSSSSTGAKHLQAGGRHGQGRAAALRHVSICISISRGRRRSRRRGRCRCSSCAAWSWCCCTTPASCRARLWPGCSSARCSPGTTTCGSSSTPRTWSGWAGGARAGAGFGALLLQPRCCLASSSPCAGSSAGPHARLRAALPSLAPWQPPHPLASASWAGPP
jgi:hypothetical protein